MFLELDKKIKNNTAAIDIQGKRISYGELVIYAEQFSNFISERTVAFILCRNDVSVLQVYLACMINKVVPLLIGEHTEKTVLENLIREYCPAYIFGYKDCLEKLISAEYEEVIDKTDFCVVRTGMMPYPLYPDLSLLLTTSGSTGSPKLVRHSYFNLKEQAKNISKFFEMDGTERPMIDLPIMYTYGLSVVNSHLYAGATLLMSSESIMSKNFWNFFRKEGATSFTGVPYSYELLKRLHFFKMDLPSLKMLSQGGGKLSEELQKEFAEYIIGCGGKYIATYGQTECSARMSFLPSELAIKKCGSIGKAIPNGKLYLKDSDGNVIKSAEQVGELYYEGPNVTLGYAQCGTDLIKGDEHHGVIATGDLAYMDKDGYFYISGRKKRFLKLYGYRVSLDECEKIVKNEFQIECACTGTDKKLLVCILQKEYLSDVKKLLLEKTNLYASAVEIKVIKEIPRNAAGKILYAKLCEFIEK